MFLVLDLQSNISIEKYVFQIAFGIMKILNVLDALFKVPSLETVYLYRIELPYFPPGPSNIKHLELDCVMAEYLFTKFFDTY